MQRLALKLEYFVVGRDMLVYVHNRLDAVVRLAVHKFVLNQDLNDLNQSVM